MVLSNILAATQIMVTMVDQKQTNGDHVSGEPFTGSERRHGTTLQTTGKLLITETKWLMKCNVLMFLLYKTEVNPPPKKKN